MSNFHKCEQEKEIKQIMKSLYGNGQPGLIQTVAGLSVTIEGFTEAMKQNSTVQRGLLSFMTEEQTKAEVLAEIEKKTKSRINWLVALNITTGLGLLSLVVTLILYIAK